MGTIEGLGEQHESAVIQGGAAGDHQVPGGIDTDKDLICVYHFSADLVTQADLTAEFSITDAGVINNNAGTATTGDFLLVAWKGE